jgi:vezatin
VVKSFAEALDLEKYHDIYDISDLDMADASQGFQEETFDDAESLRTLKIVAARFHTIRKMFLCSLLALEATGEQADFLRWTTAVEGLRELNDTTRAGYERLQAILGEEESKSYFFQCVATFVTNGLSAFPSVQTPMAPLSPGRERWRSQLWKLNSLSTGIRGLQAKLTLLREESDHSLNDADDVSQLGPNLLAQYDSIGQDLKVLMHAWEEGRAALASGIDRNEKRLSSISTVLSPASSLSGLTTVEEGGAIAALRALTGESPTPSTASFSPREPNSEEIFEAVAMPRPRSLFSREERIAKMKEDRERKAEVREQSEANRGMLRELEMVINLRPKSRTHTPSAAERLSL